MVGLAYGPAWRAGFVWDDREILTANPCIVGPLGLRQIWTTHFADTCPLTLSALWLGHAWWGLSPTPFHVANVLLHAACACLLWRVLRALRIPGAWLGAALWALHPVEVESVAYVAEMKNTLSGLFFLGAILYFLRWLQGGRWCYALSLLCAALAMAAKSSTVILPVILGLNVWWTEGRIRRRHVIALGPMFLMAAAASALTLWTQHGILAQTGDMQWVRPWPGRWVSAGGAVWFYLGKLLWPHPLIAVYPRWRVDAGRWLEWLPLLGIVGVFALLWRWRGSAWGRAGVFAFACFLVALLPALGLLDGTDFHYSLVFDHFQYLASMGAVALAAAGATRLAGNAGWPRALGVIALLALGTLTWQRSGVYRDEETFWTDTVTKNSACWSGHGNLGSVLLLKGQVDEARSQYEQALAANPDYAEAHNNLGIIFLRQGKTDDAIAQIERAVAINPQYAEARGNLGNAHLANGQVDEAIAQYERALAINPDFHALYFNLGNARFAKGQIDEAITAYERALALNPDNAEAHSNLGNALLTKRQPAEAILHYERALALRPDYADAHNNLGLALVRTARFDEAVVQFQETLRLSPVYPNVQRNLLTAQTLARRARPSP